MLFENSLGIDIQNDFVAMAYLKNSFTGARLSAHTVFSFEKDLPVKGKLEIIMELAEDLRKFWKSII